MSKSQSQEFKLPGTTFDLIVSFPWEDQVFIRAALVNRSGGEVERWEKKISDNVFNQYIFFIPTAKAILNNILGLQHVVIELAENESDHLSTKQACAYVGKLMGLTAGVSESHLYALVRIGLPAHPKPGKLRGRYFIPVEINKWMKDYKL